MLDLIPAVAVRPTALAAATFPSGACSACALLAANAEAADVAGDDWLASSTDPLGWCGRVMLPTLVSSERISLSSSMPRWNSRCSCRKT